MKLSKTNYLRYRDCQKNAWLKIHKPEISNQYPLSSFELNIIETGNEIDVLARELFPNGILIENREDNEYTKQLMDGKSPVIYQPVFITPKYITACDIFVFDESTGCYDLYEVKSSTGKEEDGGRNTKDYIVDMAFQKVVLEDLNITINKTYLVRLNKEYIKRGDIDIKELFLIEDFSAQVSEILPEIRENMAFAYDFLSQEKEPKGHCDCIIRGLNGHCTTSPYSNKDIPEYPVHQISRIHRTKLINLVDNNIFSIYDVPEDFELSENQRRQVNTAQWNREYVDHDGIIDFLDTIQYPIAFLDYETYPSAIPRFDGYRPYQQIPFQFSLHVKETPDSELIHFEFLHTEDSCPDESFAKALDKYVPKTGSVVVWNMKFEKGINTQTAERLLKYAKLLQSINDRVVDLIIPFSGKTIVYDHPQFKGSASIKYVLPALVPELSYKDLHIQEGGTASDTWNSIVMGEYSDNDLKTKIQALKDYCLLDTLAMVKIWEVLKNKVD